MTSWVGVVPFVHRPFMEECRATMHPSFLPHVLWVDNTVHNIGIMASHNRGIDRMRDTGADWLVVMSAAIRFGAPGGVDFIAALEDRPDHHVVEAEGVFGWHLIAFHRRTLDAAGRWDENFSPYGFDDLDMSLRIQRAFGLYGRLWQKVVIDVSDVGMGHSVRLCGVRAETDDLIGYFRWKWGRHPGESDVPAYDMPFNDPAHAVNYWPQAPNGGRWDA